MPVIFVITVSLFAKAEDTVTVSSSVASIFSHALPKRMYFPINESSILQFAYVTVAEPDCVVAITSSVLLP